MLARVTLIALLAAGWSGCGSERSAAEKCDDFFDLVCARVAECTATSEADCLKGFGMKAMCSSVKQVSATYDACMSKLHEGTCSTLTTTSTMSSAPVFTQPAACSGVLSPG